MAKKIIFRKASPPPPTTDIYSNGITWTVQGVPTRGQFITGDWWVLDPGSGIEIISVSPTPTGSGSSFRNGSMVNPTLAMAPSHVVNGFDGRNVMYDPSVRQGYPFTLVAGQSLISCESADDSAHTDVTGNTFTGWTMIKQAAVLTCVASVPPADAFRPAYVGTNKAIYTGSQILWSLLPNLTPSSGVRSQSTYENWVTKFWLDCGDDWMAHNLHPYLQMPTYGREIAGAVGEAALFTCCNYTQAQKQNIVYGLIQIGIDNYYSALLNQHLWPVSGGQTSGRKFPIIYAGKLLGQSSFFTPTYDASEDVSYYGDEKSPTHVLWTGWQNSGHKYAANILKRYRMPAYDSNNLWEQLDPSQWGSSPWPVNGEYPYDHNEVYSRQAIWAQVGQALATRIIGAKANWNKDAFFAMADRWMYEDTVPLTDTIIGYWWAYEQSHPPPMGSLRSQGDGKGNCQVQHTLDGKSSWSDFITSMWNAYRTDYD